MPIDISCGTCGKRFAVAEQHIGKKGRCPGCSSIVNIVPQANGGTNPPSVAPKANQAANKASTPSTAATPRHAPPAASVSSNIKPVVPGAAAVKSPATAPTTTAKPAAAVLTPSTLKTPSPTPSPATASPKPSVLGADDAPVWLRHLHWLLLIAMLPLAHSTFFHADNIQERLEATLDTLDEETLQLLSNDGQSVFDHLPDHKLQGAWLSRDTSLHWVLAGITVAAFLLFFCFLAIDGSAHPLHLLGVGAFTATAGVFLLMGFQWLAGSNTFRRVRIGRLGIIRIIIWLIGMSYAMADDPEFSFWPSFFGFTFGVGFCEEVCKALPMLGYYSQYDGKSWRHAFLWGLASGAGFGVAESVLYSSRHYNGIFGMDIYLVRFISCVALHAVWAGSVGISIQRQRKILENPGEDGGTLGYVATLLKLVLVPMILHGLYDVLLKKDMPVFALGVAGFSFGWLAWQIYSLHGDDDRADAANFEQKYLAARTAFQQSR